MKGLLLLLSLLSLVPANAQVFGSANANRLRGRALSTCSPLQGQGYTWDTSTQTWTCTTPNTTITGLGALGTGVLKNTTGTGVISIVAGSPTDCVKVDGTSGTCGSSSGYTTVTFSSTPSFTAASGTGTTFLLTLTGNVSSSTLAGATTGQILTFRLCQDGAGGHPYVPPTNVLNSGAISSAANSCTNQTFIYDGANAQAIGVAVVTGGSGSSLTMPGSSSGSMVLVPPASGGGTVTGPTGTTKLAGVDVANTGGAAMTLDMSASTSATALRTPNVAGAAPTTAGTVAYDTTNKNVHWGANGVDNIAGLFLASALPANNDCIKASVVSSVVRLVSSGGACGGGGGSVQSIFIDPAIVNGAGGFSTPLFSLQGTLASGANTIGAGGGALYATLKSGASGDSFQSRFGLPSGVTSVDVLIQGFAETTTGNSLGWSGTIGCRAVGDTFNGGTANAASTDSRASTTTNLDILFTLSSLNLTSCATNSAVYLNVTRTGTYASNFDFNWIRIDLHF